ncbi:MAG TPA: hypothetical protein VIQ30_00640 [Pseudonocardia sp.]
MTVALALLAVLLLIVLGVVCLFWRACVAQLQEVEDLARHLAADLDALSIAGPTVYAALTPDAEPPVPAGWLDDLNQLPTTHEREYPR